MSQRNLIPPSAYFASSSSASSPASSEAVADLVDEVEKLSARLANDVEEYFDENEDDDDEVSRRLCSLLSKVHSPGVARQVGFVHLESTVLGTSCPSTRRFFESLGRDLRRLRDDVLVEAIGCMDTLAELMAFVLEEMKDLDPVGALGSFESLPVTGLHVIKSCYKICADIG